MRKTNRSMDRQGGDFHPQRTRSPAYTRYKRHDAGTAEIIRFVRENQLERQPTILRLQKKAPLPEIGQMPPVTVQDSGFVDRQVDNSYSDDFDAIDNEVASIEASAEHLYGPLTSGKKMSDLRVHRKLSFNSKSLQVLPSSKNNPTRFPNKSVNKSFNGRYMRTNKLLNPLPPLNRAELPARPSAPSPSVTPPILGEEDELDSAGEPIDFIDPA